MLCPRCGTAFEGNFCPQCGAPVSAPAAAPPLAFTVTCPRCGTAFRGNFCPRCGLPAGSMPYAPQPAATRGSPDLHRILSVLWALALAGFFVLIALNFAGLLLGPSVVVPGIEGISSGQNANQFLATGDANWTFQALNASAATGTYVASGGNPGGYLGMTLPAGSTVGGEWVEAFQLTGSTPYAASVHLDYRAPVPGDLVISVETTPGGLNYAAADAIVPVTASASWTTTPTVDVSASLRDPGTYYLKVAFIVSGNPSTAQVGFDNVRLGWITDAAYYFYVPLPLPVLVFISQDQGGFLTYYVFLIAAIVLSGAWYTVRERKRLARAFTLPMEDIRDRLRSMSAWVAVGQVWLASTFFQYAVILLIALVGIPASSPISTSPTNAWTDIFLLTMASVYEEITFRLLLIGVPMALAALLWRAANPRPVTAPVGPAGAPSALHNAWRYLWGGHLRRESSREAKLVAGILVLISSALWAVAHAAGGGWGWWKVVPVFVAGLGAGYIYVRHGLGASILLHFATDGSLALSLMGVGGVGLDLFTTLLILGLAVAGSGFFVWYILYGWEEFQDLRRSYGARVVRPPMAAATAPPGPPPGGWSYAPPPVSVSGAGYPAAPPTPPPPSYAPPPPPQTWSPPTGPAPPPGRGGLQLPPGYVPTYHPPPYGYPPVRFQCPYCGWVEARYENRGFTCLRCGRTA